MLRRIRLHRCSVPLIVNHLYYLFSAKSHELSKSILITDKTRKNSTAGAITGVQMLGLGGGGNQIWSGIPKVQGYFWPHSGGGRPAKNANFPKVPVR